MSRFTDFVNRVTTAIILDFPEEFPGCKIIKLEENYRSTQPILNLTNEILRRARE